MPIIKRFVDLWLCFDTFPNVWWFVSRIQRHAMMILQASMIMITHGMFFNELPVVILREFNNCGEGLWYYRWFMIYFRVCSFNRDDSKWYLVMLKFQYSISLVSDFDFFFKFPSNFVSMKALNLIGKIKLWKLFM